MKLLRSWPRIASLLVVITAAAIATAMPSSASAQTPLICPAIYPAPASCKPVATIKTAPLGHVGWTYLNLNYCAPGLACTMQYRINTPAWRWTGAAWVKTTLNGGWVYVYPYSSPWRWAWTQESGWVAISGGRFELRSW